MSEITISGQKYQIGRLNARTQFHVARRLAPVVPDIVGSLSLFRRMIQGEKIEIGQITKLIDSGALGLARMSDGDANRVLDECLSVVTVQQNGAWVGIWAVGAGPMFDFIGLPEMMHLVWAVVQSNLMTFFPAPQPISK